MSRAPEPPPSADAIEAFGGGGFRIGGRRHAGSVLILGAEVAPFAPRRLEDVTLESLGPAVAAAGALDLLLLGAGAQLRPAPREVREGLRRAGLGLEVLTTVEACRLYNLLAFEGRRLAAALIAVD